MEWIDVKFSDFLKERKGRYKPNDEAIKGLKRIEKIDFSGQVYLSDKPSKTDMILVKDGDLVISGINVEKGAMNIFHGNEDVVATIHYSSYTYDTNVIELEFLKHFLKSKKFKDVLKEQVPGGIKTEIKPKHLLPLQIQIPKSLDDQKKIVEHLDQLYDKLNDSSTEITHQLDLIKNLRQAFLREAMQGLLVSNETSDGKTGADLLAHIQAEKAQLVKEKKIKKPKPLAPITEEEIPFDIPKNWTWCRLGEIAEIGTGATPLTSNSEYYINADIPWMTSSETSDLFVYKTEKFITKKAIEETNCKVYPINTLVIAMYGQGKTRGQITELKIEAATNQACATINIYKYNQNFNSYIKYYFLKIYDEIRLLAQGGAQPNLNMDKIRNTIISLPPLEIQERIVAKLDELMAVCDALETQVKQSKNTNEQLLQEVLREALGGKNEKKETNVLKIIPKQCNNVEKTVLAGYIINQSNTPDFGKVKFQKILHLTEYHCQIGVNSNYSKKVAGPHDTTLINNLVTNLQRFNFYKIDDKNKKHDFIEMSSSNELVEKFNDMFDDQKKSVNQIIELFSNKSWEFCELISTLYAVWNNRIINKEDITNELLTHDFLKWNESKIKFIDKIDYGIKWIKDHNLEPLGWGNIIE